MKKGGSITVFLSLILTLLFSFVLTSLEAARLEGARFYVSMLSSMTGDSFLATYYFPLFEEYGLLGVDAGYGTRYFLQEQIEETLQGHVVCATDSMKGGFLQLDKPKADVLDYETLFLEDEFLEQVEQQAVYEGFHITLDKLLDTTALKDSAMAGELYQKQAELQKEMANITTELLKLMTLVDGISTGEQGIVPDKQGNPKTEASFIKQLAPMSADELKTAFQNDMIYHALSSSFIYPQSTGASILQKFEQALLIGDDISKEEERINECNLRLNKIPTEKNSAKELQKEWENKAKEAEQQEKPEVVKLALAQVEYYEHLYEELVSEESRLREETGTRTARRKELQKEYKEVVKAVKPSYESFRKQIAAVLPVIRKALPVIDRLEKKQKAAQGSVIIYESFLNGREAEMSSELYQVFADELETMKLYLDMKEQGYSPEIMRSSLIQNEALLQQIQLPDFNAEEVRRMYSAVKMFLRRIEEYSLEGLWFTYGDLKPGKETGQSVKQAMQSFLESGICSLAGISEHELSEAEVSGVELPSALLSYSGVCETLTECISELSQLFSEQNMEFVKDTMALELYLANFFSDYKNPKEGTRLLYEREYILFGQKNDRSNMVSMILYLVAFRSLLTMSALLKSAEKQAQLSAVASTIAGFTGIPLLTTVIKYTLLLLWSLEEAVVEVSALLQGKRISFLSAANNVSIGEVFAFNKEMVSGKAKKMTESPLGMKYSEYLLCFSLMERTRTKCYRAMDLIQENLRMRYRDSFRVRNVVTELEYQITANLKQKWSSELWLSDIYRIQNQNRVQY